jgi:hypothetical protein
MRQVVDGVKNAFVLRGAAEGRSGAHRSTCRQQSIRRPEEI